MTNPLLVAWSRLLRPRSPSRATPAVPRGVLTRAVDDVTDPEAGILLVLRRLRIPIIVVIGIFTVAVIGLMIIPGQDTQGRPVHLSMFDAFYFISYMATTTGFSEFGVFTTAQRLWVTFCIYLTVVGWAYGIGSLLTLTQDQAFRRTLTRRHVARKIEHLAEPFLILVGYGSTMQSIARALDAIGRRFVILDTRENRVSAVDLGGYQADTPALLGDARDTRNLIRAGLAHPQCDGVLALAGDDTVNLDVTMTTALLRPGLRVIAGTSSREMARRMRSFERCEVIDHLDRFGDHLRILLRSPAAYQLMVWLTSAPGTPLPGRRESLGPGRWVVCGTGQFAVELAADLDAEGVPVTVARPDERLDEAGLRDALAFVAACDDDTTNLWFLETARRANPELFTVALQHRVSNVPLFEALDVDFGMTPAQVMSIEVMARLTSPTLMRLLPQIPRLGEQWSEGMLDRLVERCGRAKADLWRVRLDGSSSAALRGYLAAGAARLGDLLRDPAERDRPLGAVPLLLVRDDEAIAGPPDNLVVREGDEILLAAGVAARRALEATLLVETTAAYVVEGRVVPSTWVGRSIAGWRSARADTS